MIHGHPAAISFGRDSRGSAEVVKLQHAPGGPGRITITALVEGMSLEVVLGDREPVEVEPAESTPESLPSQQATEDRASSESATCSL